MAKIDNGELNSSIFGSNSTDPNNSLLKKVTKRVSGLFPSSLTKWFGPSDSHSVVRRRNSVDEDDEDISQVQEPPKKRAKPSCDVDFASTNSFKITSTPLINSRNDRHLQPGPSGYTRHSTLSVTTTSLNYDSSSVRNETTVANGDNKSDSGDSTSGYSSVQPQLHKESSFISDKEKIVCQPSTSKTSPNKSLNVSMNSSRSLFSEQSLNPQRQCLNTRRPSFSASTFGSPSFVDRTLSTKRAVNSPFYGGPTIYGGASAYRRNKIIFPRNEAHSVTIKNSIDIKPVQNTSSNNDSVNLSKTARRILDTLEHFSTPVLDAKKIPNINRQSCDINKSSIQRRTSNSKEKNSIPNKELLIPTVPDLIKMKLKERLQDSTVKVRQVATTSKSVLNTEYSIRSIEETSKPQKHISKIKTKITSLRDRNESKSDTIDIVQLPEVKLPITKLPEFNFTLPPPPTVSVKPPSTSEIIKNISSAPTTRPVATLNTVSTRLNFANPIIISEKPKSAPITNNFTFSEPINAKTNTSVNSTVITFTFNSTMNNTAPRKKEISKNNGQNNVGLSLQPPIQFVTGSVMDILGKPEKPLETDNLMNKFKPAADTWECNTCMIRNTNLAIRCVACETLRENPKKMESQNFEFENKFKMPSDKWECSVCMVRNNIADTKCVACTTAKPVPVSGTLPIASTTNTTNSLSGFGDKFKPALDTWECSVCMVRNKNDTVKCVACETPKPGGKNESKSSLIMACEMKTNNSGFGDFIKKQQTNWECGSCMVRNPPEKNICACCEAPKPGEKHDFKFGIQPANQFKFGIDNSINSGFKFGIDNVSPATTFSFGVKSVDNTTDVKSKTKNEVTPIMSEFSFGIPATSKIENTKESPSKPTVCDTAAVLTVNNAITFNTSLSNKIDKSVPNTSIAFNSTTVTMKSSEFNFGVVPTSTNENNEAKPSFSVNATSIASSTTNSSVVSLSTVKPISTNIIFGNVSSVQSTTSFNTTSAPTITSLNTTKSSPATLSFATSTKPLPINSDNKLPSSQFNFGSGTCNNTQVASIPDEITTCAASPSIGNNTTVLSYPNTDISNKTEISASGCNQPAFTFCGGNNVSNNKSEVKSFAFIGGGEPASKIPAFTFSQNASPVTGAPLSKGSVFNFGASSTSGTSAVAGTNNPATNIFNFGGHKTEKSVTFGTGNSSVFGDTVLSSTIPQNGGFNFGSTNAPMSFNFGAGNNPTPTSTPVFGFGSSQAGSGSVTTATGPAVASSGVFKFGNPAATQQQTPAFSPDIKPNFNFTGGSLPSFTAQSAPLAGAQRKFRKAIRRTQPR